MFLDVNGCHSAFSTALTGILGHIHGLHSRKATIEGVRRRGLFGETVPRR
jgi:hypothetical protein